MKKLNLIVWMAALMGLATSCSKDDASLPGNPENSNRVSMSVTLPQDMAATRAVPAAPSGHQLRCILEVWTADGNTLKIRKELAKTDETNFTFEFELSDAGNYKAVLWADYIDASTTESSGYFADKYYTTNAGTPATGLKAVAVKTLTADDASYRDAFTGVEGFTKGTAALSLTPTLTRALTKISIYEKTQANYDLCQKVTATYKVPSKFNAFTGTVDLANYNYFTDASYAAAPEGSTTSMLLFSDYVLANADGTLGEIALKFESNDTNKPLPDVTISAGIPAKRNYRINAKGNLIKPSDAPSNSVKMEVSIDNDFTGEQEVASQFKAKVGDFYYKDGTWSSTYTGNTQNPCIGIVYVVNPDGKTGKVVGLTEGINLYWSTEQVETGATSETDGRANMATLATYITNNNKSWDAYPAFKWVAEQNGKPDGGWDASNDKWYLPAKEELQALYAAWNGDATKTANDAARTAFNAQLTSARGTVLSANVYWPSSENSSNDSWYVYFPSGITYYYNKTYNYLVRCVRGF